MTTEEMIEAIEELRNKSPLLPKHISVSLDIYENLETFISTSHIYLIQGIYLSGLPVKLSKYLPLNTWVEHFDDFYIVHRPDCTFRV